MRKIKALFLLVALTGYGFADECMNACCCDCCPSFCWQNLYVGIEGGMDISTRMNFAPDYRDAPNNVEFKYGIFQDPNLYKTDMGTAPFYGAKLGYFIQPQLSVDLSYDYRGHFKWSRAYSLPTGDFFTEAERVSVGDIHSQTVMVNARFFPTLDWCSVAPFATAGAGVAFNHVGRVVEKSLSNENPVPLYNESEDNHSTSFTWQVGLGFDYCYTDNLFFTVGYRFVDIGRIESGDRIKVSNIAGQVGASITPLLENHVQFNELYFGINYKLGCLACW